MSPPERGHFYAPTPILWDRMQGLTPYPQAHDMMETRVVAIHAGREVERVCLLEHPPLYTAGTSADPSDLVSPDKFDVFETGRGGQYTYHGPGQRVAYAMLDLRKRGRDVSLFVRMLEQWIIDSLGDLGVEAGRRQGRVGVWVTRADGREDKIAAIGVRLRKWISFHGIAINVDPDLSHFGGIVPCGITEHGVTSLADLGVAANMDRLDAALKSNFERLIGPTKPA